MLLLQLSVCTASVKAIPTGNALSRYLPNLNSRIAKLPQPLTQANLSHHNPCLTFLFYLSNLISQLRMMMMQSSSQDIALPHKTAEIIQQYYLNIFIRNSKHTKPTSIPEFYLPSWMLNKNSSLYTLFYKFIILCTHFPFTDCEQSSDVC